LRSALSLTENYRSDGSQSVVTQRIYDALYPKGHTYQKITSSGRLDQLALQGGPGLSQYGNWKLQEKVSDGPVSTQTVTVRKITALLQLPAGNLYQNNGNIAYQIRVATFPADWNPGDIGWKLRLRDGDNQQLNRQLRGNLSRRSQPTGAHVCAAVGWAGRGNGRKTARWHDGGSFRNLQQYHTGGFSHMLVGYMRVSSDSDRQTTIGTSLALFAICE